MPRVFMAPSELTVRSIRHCVHPRARTRCCTRTIPRSRATRILPRSRSRPDGWKPARGARARASLFPTRARLCDRVSHTVIRPPPARIFASLSKVLETLVAVQLRSSVVPNVGVRMQLLHTLCQPWAVGALERRRGVVDALKGGSAELVRLLELELSTDSPEPRTDGAPSHTLWRRMTSGGTLTQANAATAFAEANSSKARAEIAIGLLEQIAITSQSTDAARAAVDALASAQDRASARAEADSEAFAWSDLKQSVRPRWKRGVASATGY